MSKAKKKPAPKAAPKKRAPRAKGKPVAALFPRGSGAPHLIGYARVSTAGQTLASQLDALEAHGCERVFSEKISGNARTRPAWEAMIEQLRRHDIVVVQAIDRIGRNMEEVTRCMRLVAERGAFIRSLKQPIDTSQPGHGEILTPLIIAIAQIQRVQLVERTREGLAAAAKRGNFPGRPVTLTPAKIELVRHLDAKHWSRREIAEEIGLSERSVVRALAVPPVVEGRQLKLGGT